MLMGETPVARLERVFTDIAVTRMAGVPILNPALRVEAVGFREWEGRWIGVLVTPWFINLVLLPGDQALLEPLRLDEKQTWVFPSGGYEFMGLNEAELGVCHLCPLISPVMEFATHQAAVEVAQEIADTLFRGVQPDGERADQLADMLEETRLKGESMAHQQVSRRDFLRTPFLGR
jgi:[NiFe] hydrogenase assembly HybE family chaperone